MKLNIVPARTGILWVKLGIQTFFRQPLALSALFFLYMTALSALSVLPLLGAVLALVIGPLATLSLMAAAQEAEKGSIATPSVLLTGLRVSRLAFRPMMVLGLMYAAACAAVVAIVIMVVEVPPAVAGAGREAMLTPEFQRVMLVALVLYLPVALLFWHAPALVYWHGVTPVKSLFFSLVACVRNAGAFLVFGVCWVGVLLLFGMVISVIGGLGGNPVVGAMVLVPGFLMMATMFYTSIYFSFRDSFLAPPDAQPTPTPGKSP